MLFVTNTREHRTALYLLLTCQVTESPRICHLHIIGFDFARLLYAKTKNSEDEIKESQKVYVCLFTCTSVGAVHLELTRALSVESFLLAFQRFTSRSGLLAAITSDNAKTFRSSSQDIRNISRAEEVWRYLTNKQITRNFIIEKGPVVGRILGTTCEKFQETFKEDPREIYSQF